MVDLVAVLKHFWLILCLSSLIYVVNAINSEGRALLALSKGWKIGPSGAKLSWNELDLTPCSWVGVKCDKTLVMVVGLNLSRYEISGQLGPEISGLEHLTSISVSDNDFFGSIPYELGNCSYLEDLDLSLNRLTGQIPSTLGNLQNLWYLNLYSNSLSGEISKSLFWNLNLISVYLNDNSFSGSIPSHVGNMSQIETLSLSSNHLSGTIPSSIGNCTTLQELNLNNNQLVGSLPRSFKNLKHLSYLDVSNNKMSGKIPRELGMLKEMQVLYLFSNRLTGEIPDFVNHSSMLHMSFSDNLLSGSIPYSFKHLSSITFIDLSMNTLSGVVPLVLGSLLDLRVLNLSHNRFIGLLPNEIFNCQKLLQLDMSYNLLKGSIVHGLRNLTELSTLSLSENGFSGGIPTFLFEFGKLSNILLDGNKLGGYIPSSIGAAQNLRLLNLRNCGLTGEIPPEIGNLVMLEQLILSNNNFSGNLSIFDNTRSLITLDVSNNSFSGPIPFKLMKFFDSSPTSFQNNPGLCVDCSSCSRTKFFRTCSRVGSGNKKVISKKTILLIVLVSLALLFIILFGLAYTYLWKEQPEESSDEESTDVISASLLDKIMVATENLNDRYIIGRGAHGTVYKATLGTDEVYALKKIMRGESDGGTTSMNREAETVGMIRHRNIIKLEAFWLKRDYGLLLYPYMNNGSLHDILHNTNPPCPLNWNIRYKIAIGSAQGLSYLHFDCVPPILHRDIKPMNVLLDSEFEPRISDFGIAKLLEGSTLRTSAAGTINYMAPEAAHTMVMTKESDVYSYGVMLLELITRKKAADSSSENFEGIVQWVRSIWDESHELKEIVDPGLLDELINSRIMVQVTRVLLMAIRCTDTEPNNRPSMRSVVNELMDIGRHTLRTD